MLLIVASFDDHLLFTKAVMIRDKFRVRGEVYPYTTTIICTNHIHNNMGESEGEGEGDGDGDSDSKGDEGEGDGDGEQDEGCLRCV